MNRHIEARPYTTWQLVSAFWRSKESRFAYALFFTLIALTLIVIGLDVAITQWYNHFYNSLQAYNLRATLDLLWIFAFLAAIHVVLVVYMYYAQSYFALRWRRWLTEEFLTRWLKKRSYYYLEHFDKQTDNPDQRIQEDILALVNFSLELVLGIISSIGTILAFIFILWKLSGVITIPLGSLGTWHVSGYLVWVSVIYAVIGSIFTFKIGHPLVQLNFEQQRREANFRYGAVDLRTHAENVALYRGEHHQKTVLTGLLTLLLENWYRIILRTKRLKWLTGGYNQISVLVPLAVALPNYFNKVFELGGLIQSLAAFDRIQNSLSFLVNAYTMLAEWSAVKQRLLTFLNHMYDVERNAALQDHFQITTTPKNQIIAQEMFIHTPLGEELLENLNETFVHGKNYWIRGHSGIGKSTFVRAIAGIWPYGSGKIELPDNKKVMYLPQKTYMPLGTLKEAILFPDGMTTVPESELAMLLKKCGLPALADELHDTKAWSECLSPGELQRIAFVRVLLQKPDWIFLDESTSALDLPNEKKMYELLKTHLPNCSVISVGHRPSLVEYHDHEIDMKKYSVERVAEV